MVFHIAYFGTKYFSSAYAVTLTHIGEVAMPVCDASSYTMWVALS